MTRHAALLAVLITGACAQPDLAMDSAERLQQALATHEASIAGIGGRPAGMPMGVPVDVPSGGSVVGGEPPAALSRATAAAGGAALAPGASSPTGATPGVAGDLVGQTPEALLRWLGEPRLRREEGPAEIWHYQASECHLDLILYPDDGPRPLLRVAFAAARAVGTVRRGEAACLRDIARGAARPGPSVSAEVAAAG